MKAASKFKIVSPCLKKPRAKRDNARTRRPSPTKLSQEPKMKKPPATKTDAASKRFRREQHIRSGDDFRRAYARRCSASDGTIIVVGRENRLAYTRLGLSVSRKAGSAVVRNRWKRLIREAFRISQSRLPAGTDLVVIPRLGVEPELAAIIQSLPQLAARVSRKLARTKKSPNGTDAFPTS